MDEQAFQVAVAVRLAGAVMAVVIAVRTQPLGATASEAIIHPFYRDRSPARPAALSARLTSLRPDRF